ARRSVQSLGWFCRRLAACGRLARSSGLALGRRLSVSIEWPRRLVSANRLGQVRRTLPEDRSIRSNDLDVTEAGCAESRAQSDPPVDEFRAAPHKKLLPIQQSAEARPARFHANGIPAIGIDGALLALVTPAAIGDARPEGMPGVVSRDVEPACVIIIVAANQRLNEVWLPDGH